MSQDRGDGRGTRGDGHGDLDGLSVDAAVDAVDDERTDPGRVRETLAIVASDGTVRRAAVDDALANASKVVTTAETRTELAARKLSEAREDADPVLDLPPVSSRVDGFAARLDAIEDRAEALGDDVQAILERKDDGDLYRVARRIREVTDAARETQRVADDLQLELDSFREWLADADRREADLADDVDAVADALDGLDATVSDIPAATEEDGGDAAARRWAAATIRHRVLSLMIADLRAELSALRTWAEREGIDPPSNVDPRIDDLAARHETAGNRLADRADPAWTERFDDRLTAVERALGGMEPPIDWADVEAVVDEHRPDLA
ncbi:hypothetical protein [Haloparvum sedimenti]|uniref:hypothetical protein n=1 Tax=Haloparvum sedimenti TaxID=1678448 RepID=UPI00071E7A3A|nr:hypothetical protein [Haloparvum sedimenti]